MKAVGILLPVFVMIGLGLLSRLRHWISSEQLEGLNAVVFNVLFPILIFNILLTSSFKAENFAMMAYVLAAFLIIMVLAKLFLKAAGPFASLAPFLCVTDEGGSVGLPLYISLVGASYAVNTVTFDVAGCLITFALAPILASGAFKKGGSFKSALKNIFTNSFLIAVILGLVLNFLGLYDWMQNVQISTIYDEVISMVTGPVSAMILFIIGYRLRYSPRYFKNLLGLMGLRMVFMVMIVGGLFLFFGNRMADPIFLAGVLIYFACPPAFAMPQMIAPLFHSQDDEAFCSDFISMNILITLVVYVLVELFIPLP